MLLKAENIKKEFRAGNTSIQALKNLSVEIEEGSLTIFKGRSGSGKTTLINILSTIDVPTSGKVFFDNKQIDLLRELEKDALRQSSFGILFQSGALIPNMTLYENVEFLLRVAGVKGRERKARSLECIEKVGLLKKIHQFPEELSGGEAQRAALARAIVNRPRVLFADEPTSALDFDNSLKVVQIMKELVAEEGVTIVMTTHDPNIVQLADKVYNLEDGEIVNG
jgi:putative ABC transport system ATP-binding protein